MAASLVGCGDAGAMTIHIAPDGGAEGAAEGDGEVWASADLDEDDALRLFGMRARAFRDRGVELFLIGATPNLQGWPAAAILGVHHGISDACSLWAPAAPQAGFTTSDGVQMRGGAPLPLPHASLLYQIHSAACGTTLDPERTRIATVRGHELERRLERAWRRRHRLPVCDAESQGDLERIVGAALRVWTRATAAAEAEPKSATGPLVLAGTHALATALATQLTARAESAALGTTWPAREKCGGNGREENGVRSGFDAEVPPTPLMIHGSRAARALFEATETTVVQACGVARGGFVAARPLDGSLCKRTIWLRRSVATGEIGGRPLLGWRPGDDVRDPAISLQQQAGRPLLDAVVQ